MRIITSTSAAARLDAARASSADDPPATERIIVGASRGAADDLARAIARQAGATFGITRFSLTELAARAAAAHPAADGACPARRPARKRSPRTPCSTRWPPMSSPTSSRSRACRAFPRRWRARCTSCGWRACGHRASNGPTTTTEPTSARTIADAAICSRLLARVEAELARSGVDDRAALFRLARRRVPRRTGAMGEAADRSCSTCRSTRAPSRSSPRRWSPDRRTCSRPCPTATTSALDALVALGGTVEQLSRLQISVRFADLRFGLPASLRVSDRASRRARARRRRACCSRRRAKGARRWRSCGACSTKPAAACRSTRWRCFSARRSSISGCSSTRARAAACPVYFDRGTRRPDPAGRAFVALLSCAVDGLSAKRFDEYLSLGQVPQRHRRRGRSRRSSRRSTRSSPDRRAAGAALRSGRRVEPTRPVGPRRSADRLGR